MSSQSFEEAARALGNAVCEKAEAGWAGIQTIAYVCPVCGARKDVPCGQSHPAKVIIKRMQHEPTCALIAYLKAEALNGIPQPQVRPEPVTEREVGAGDGEDDAEEFG